MRSRSLFYLFTCFVFWLLPINLYALSSSKKLAAPLFKNIGNFHHTIKTTKPLAQRYFDQGLTLLYSFEYGESIRSLRAATKIDPDCAMCYWALALALGSKTDMPLDGHELDDAKNMINLAMEKVDKQNLSERLYVAALAQRYTDMSPQKMNEFAGLCSSYSAVSGDRAKNYVMAMKRLVAALPEDPDAKTLYAAALFDLTEWNFWNTQGKPNAHTLEAIHVLEDAMKIDKNHPGANHLYVHIIEWSPHPEKALPNANNLSRIVPISEHLAHMPCHTYYSVGQYHDSTLANQKAIQVYKEYVKECQAQHFPPEIQYLYYHNYDYLVAAASMEGRKQLSIDTADTLAQLIYPLAEKNIALQKMLTDSILMRVRFGDWTDIPKIPQPSSRFQYVLAMWHYAQGLAAIKRGEIQSTNKHLVELQNIIKQGPTDANLSQIGLTLMQIAEYTLKGVIESTQSNHFNQVMINFNKAVSLQDTLTSADPPPWYFPTRQLLGSFLFNSKKYSEAKMVFMADLKKHPHNGWSLYGLSLSLNKLGKNQEAERVYAEYKKTWQYSDIPEPAFFYNLVEE